jgi:hypothetical protein
VKWLKNGQELLKINGRMQKVGNDLVIANVRTADAGRYMCRAENEAGQLDTEFELEVIGKKNLTSCTFLDEAIANL